MSKSNPPGTPGLDATGLDAPALDALVGGRHGDPFAVLGPHRVSGAAFAWLVRTFQPGAHAVALVDGTGQVQEMARVHEAGVFEVAMADHPGAYVLEVDRGSGASIRTHDPYRFASTLGALDLHLMGEGTHERLHDVLGAHRLSVDDVSGVRFAVWAPNAARVAVVGDFNDWDGRRHVMRRHLANGVWELFVPQVQDGAHYKFELLGPDLSLLPLKCDPFAQRMEPPPGNASVVYTSEHPWADEVWMSQRPNACALDQPMAIYEVHLGSWRRNNGRSPTYRELTESLIPYVADMGFTHIELLPVTEHPFDGSWGYQPIGLFAPTWRFGAPDDFKYFVDCCHQANVGVIVDWVPAHFPKDAHGLRQFDGTHLYEHADPRRGEHRDWGTLIFNYGRTEVVNYLVASALYWVETFHVDALRVDAVASMLYLDYSREPGDWVPNAGGGNENHEAVTFMRELNTKVHRAGAVTMAEESTAWPQVSAPVESGGLGYTYKWNMGWMHDTLAYFGEDPVHRSHHHERLTFGMLYAFSENFILPLSHDEVVHGKGSLLSRMPGDPWQQFANLRLYFAMMYTWPGKKLMFMGAEFAQGREWDVDGALDWALLDINWHAGVQRLVRDLNGLYRQHTALYDGDCRLGGFEWIDCEDRAASVVAYVRRGQRKEDTAVVVCNCTPVPRVDYQIGVPAPGRYLEVLNTDAARYGGSNAGNAGEVTARREPMHGFEQSVRLTLPPLAALVLTPGN